MEEILVLSDLHGNIRRTEEVLRIHPECRTVLFLGDGLDNALSIAAAHPERAFCTVRGNRDFTLSGENATEVLLKIGGHTLFLCHGHTQMVKYGFTTLIRTATARGADIALFGHTHAVCDKYLPEYGLYLFNPGSIGCGDPYSGRYTYGLLRLDEKNVLFSVGEVE